MAISSKASCTSPASYRRVWSRSRRGSGSSSTTSPTDGHDSRSVNGFPPNWPGRAARAGSRRSKSWTPPCATSRPSRSTSRCRAVAKLVYVTNTSLDGYIEDQYGAFDLYEPDDDVFAATTALLRSFGTFLYGRRLYETMAVWETNPALAKQSALTADFARAWQAADKIVYSATLSVVSRTAPRLERDFDADAVRELKAAAASDLTIGGANLAA